MRSLLAGRGRRYLADAGRAFDRAPVEVAVAVCIAVAFSYAVEAGGDAFPRWLEIAVTALLMATAAWTATLLHGLGVFSTRARWSVTLAGAVLAGIYGGFVLDLERAAEGWRAAMLIGAAVLWLAAVPVFARRNVAARAPHGGAGDAVDLMRTVTGRFLLRSLGALLYSAALFAGLALALGAINTLFELRLDSEIYAHVFGWIFFVLAPWIVIGGLHEYVQPADARPEVASVVHRMTAYLVPPLLVLYYLILYAYAVRIGVTGEVPKNIVSPMVLAAGALAALALLLFDPRSGDGAAARTLRAAPPLFLPLAVLGAWTIVLRVEQYGHTEFRLLRLGALIALGLLAVAATAQLARRRRLALHAVPLTLAAVLLAGALLIPPVSRASQQARLERALHEANIDAYATAADAPLPPAPDALPPGDRTLLRPVPGELFDQINAISRYLAEHFGEHALPPAVATRITRRADIYDTATLLGLRRASFEPGAPRFVSGRLTGSATVTLGDVSAHRVYGGPGRSPAAAPGNARLRAVGDTHSLHISLAGETFEADITALLTTSGASQRGGELSMESARQPLLDPLGHARGTLLIIEIGAEIDDQGIVVLRHIEGIALISARRAD